MEVDIEFLATAEHVAAGEAQLQLGAHAPDGAVDEVGLQIDIPRLVEGAVEREVEGVAVARGELQIDGREDARAIDLLNGLGVVAVAEQAAGAQFQFAKDDTRTDGGVLLARAIEDL